MLVHPLIQTARGLCTDEAPHGEIEAILARAVDAAKNLERAASEARKLLGESQRSERRALDAEVEVLRERDTFEILLDDLCEIVVEAPNDPPWTDAGLSKFHRIRRLLRERHAAWSGWTP